MRDLKINDRSPGAEEYHPAGGLKRRASSPPSDAAREDRPTGNSGSDLYHRRSQQMLVNRNSPVSRFHANNNNSLSSASSFGGQRTGSYGSSYGLSMASTATSYNERLSPGALSPSAEAELGPTSPFVAANRAGQPAHNPSPRGSVSRASHQQMEPPHNRKMSSDSLIHSRHNSVSKMSGLYICECCPKKPKKFESEEELRYGYASPLLPRLPRTLNIPLVFVPMLTNSRTATTSWKSSTLALSVQTVSKTRTKLNAIRTRFTFGGIPGLVQL